MKVQVIGLVRFSVLTSRPDHTWGVGRAVGAGNAAAALFDEARLARRFAVFEAMTLPSLDAQDDRDFAVALVTSKLMPRPWLDRLKALAEPRDHLHVMPFDPTAEMRRFARRAVRRLRRRGDRLVTFRLDDDDALARDYVRALRRAATEAEPGAMLSAPEGLLLRAVGGGFQAIPSVWPNIALGLAHVGTGDERETIFSQGNHSRHDPASIGRIPSRAPSWIYGFHDANDSAATRRSPFEWSRNRDAPVLDAGALSERIAEGFPAIDPHRLWPAMAGAPDETPPPRPVDRPGS